MIQVEILWQSISPRRDRPHRRAVDWQPVPESRHSGDPSDEGKPLKRMDSRLRENDRVSVQRWTRLWQNTRAHVSSYAYAHAFS
jgi:hypothetical protein